MMTETNSASADLSSILAEYDDTRQLAKQFKRHARTIRRYAVEMGLPSIVIGRTRYFRRSAVVEWLHALERGGVRGRGRKPLRRRESSKARL